MIPEGIIELPNGQWTIAEDTHLSHWARQKGNIVTDPHVFAFLKPHMEKVTIIYDCGANIGDHTRQYLDWGKTVIAFEPNPLAFTCLRHNCPEADNHNVAVSDAEISPLKFLRLDNVGASRIHDEGNILVQPKVIDNMSLPAPQFIKIDIEGWEMNALKGMEKTIEDYRPMVFCEINRGALEANGFTALDVINFFAKRGYSTDTIYPLEGNHGWEQYDILFLPTTV